VQPAVDRGWRQSGGDQRVFQVRHFPHLYHECDGLGAGQSLAFVYSRDSDAEARQAIVLTKAVRSQATLLIEVDYPLGVFDGRVRVAPVL
jgi:hypothetical protein